MFEKDKDTERPITIIEVNMEKMIIDGRDRFGTPVRISLSVLDPLVAIPKAGEVWTACRQGASWFLSSRLETGSETIKISSLAEGDRRIETTGKLYLKAEEIYLNGHKLSDIITALGL